MGSRLSRVCNVIIVADRARDACSVQLALASGAWNISYPLLSRRNVARMKVTGKCLSVSTLAEATLGRRGGRRKRMKKTR